MNKKVPVNKSAMSETMVWQMLCVGPLLMNATSTLTALISGVEVTAIALIARFFMRRMGAQTRVELPSSLFLLVVIALASGMDLLLYAWTLHWYNPAWPGLVPAAAVASVYGQSIFEDIDGERSLHDNLLPGLCLTGLWLTGLCLTGSLVLLGTLRELLGQGAWLSDLGLWLGPEWRDTGFSFGHRILLLDSPAGVLILFGLLLALRNYFIQTSTPTSAKSGDGNNGDHRHNDDSQPPTRRPQRARPTGHIT